MHSLVPTTYSSDLCSCETSRCSMKERLLYFIDTATFRGRTTQRRCQDVVTSGTVGSCGRRRFWQADELTFVVK